MNQCTNNRMNESNKTTLFNRLHFYSKLYIRCLILSVSLAIYSTSFSVSIFKDLPAAPTTTLEKNRIKYVEENFDYLILKLRIRLYVCKYHLNRFSVKSSFFCSHLNFFKKTTLFMTLKEVKSNTYYTSHLQHFQRSCSTNTSF